MGLRFLRRSLLFDADLQAFRLSAIWAAYDISGALLGKLRAVYKADLCRSCPDSRHQAGHADKGNGPFVIIGERRQAER